MKVVGWLALYTENRQFSGKDMADFAALPDDGFLIQVLYHDLPRPDGHPYRTIIDGGNWYFAVESEGGVMYMCDNDTKKSIALRYPGAVIKRGKGVDLETFKLVNDYAMKTVACPTCS